MNAERAKTHITEILDNTDPLRLLACGAPRGEYSKEAEDIAVILELLGWQVSEVELGSIIQRVFVRWFGEVVKDTPEQASSFLEAARAVLRVPR